MDQTYHLPDTIQDQVHNLLAHGAVAPCVVISCILLAGDELLGVKELAVGAGTDLIWGTGSRDLTTRTHRD